MTAPADGAALSPTDSVVDLAAPFQQLAFRPAFAIILSRSSLLEFKDLIQELRACHVVHGALGEPDPHHQCPVGVAAGAEGL